MFTPRLLAAALAAVLPRSMPGVDPAYDIENGYRATPRIAFVNGQLCQWCESTTGEPGQWRVVPSVTVSDPEPGSSTVTNPDPIAPA